jgi:hypothetical protein
MPKPSLVNGQKSLFSFFNKTAVASVTPISTSDQTKQTKQDDRPKQEVMESDLLKHRDIPYH